MACDRDFNNDHLIRVKTTTVDDETISVLAETSQSHIQMAETARTRLACGGATAQNGERRVVRDGNYIAHELTIDVVCSDPVTIEKVVTLFTSKDGAISEPRLEASSRVQGSKASRTSCSATLSSGVTCGAGSP